MKIEVDVDQLRESLIDHAGECLRRGLSGRYALRSGYRGGVAPRAPSPSPNAIGLVLRDFAVDDDCGASDDW